MSEYGRPEGPEREGTGEQPYGQQPYGSPSEGPPSYGAQQPYGGGQQPYGEGQQGQPPYGAQPGQPPYGAPYGQQPYGAPYGQPPYPGYGYGYGYGQPIPQTEGTAIAALVLALGSWVLSCFGIVTAIISLVMARKAKVSIAESSGMKTGEGLVKASVIVDWIYIALYVLAVIVGVIFIILGATGAFE